MMIWYHMATIWWLTAGMSSAHSARFSLASQFGDGGKPKINFVAILLKKLLKQLALWRDAL